MNIHEHQAKGVLRGYGVAVPKGGVAFSVDEAVKIAKSLPGAIYVVKAQIHAGGRGKGGGVKLARSVDEVRELATEMLGMKLITHQTGPSGKEVKRLYVEEGCDIARELYLSVVIDRGTSRIAVMASTEGGMDIEAVKDDFGQQAVFLDGKVSQSAAELFAADMPTFVAGGGGGGGG